MPDQPAQDKTTQQDDPKAAIQQRIDQLTKARRDAERHAEETGKTNEALLQQVAASSQKISNLESQIQALSAGAGSKGADSFEDLFSSGGTKKSALPSSQGAGDVIREIIRQELAPVTDQFKAAQAQQQLAEQQKASFNQASQNFPELRDGNSDAFKVFSQIWDSREDIRSFADGPQLVAEISRGILSGARSAEKKSDESKTAANVFRTSGTQRVQTGAGEADLGQMKKLMGDLQKAGEDGKLQSNDMDAYLNLALNIAHEEAQQQRR